MGSFDEDASVYNAHYEAMATSREGMLKNLGNLLKRLVERR